MENLKIKAYWLIPLTRRQFIIVESGIFLFFVISALLLFTINLKESGWTDEEILWSRIISGGCILLTIIEAQFFLSKFIKAQLVFIQKQKREIEEQKEEILTQQEEIKAQRNVAVQQRDQIGRQKDAITDSIHYASRIQTALLPPLEFIKQFLPEHFIIYQPRDIVSGDFYWIAQKNNKTIIMAADCTGHGVPGAFMSALGIAFLNDIVNKAPTIKAGTILDELRALIKGSLHQSNSHAGTKDGMDVALCVIDTEQQMLQYAGAYNPLYLFRTKDNKETEFIQVKADRMPIGIYIKEKEHFTNHEIELNKGDAFYIFSDGFIDQFGGEQGKKFTVRALKNTLINIHQKPMTEQKEILVNKMNNWMACTNESGHEYEQIDDMLVIGVRV